MPGKVTKLVPFGAFVRVQDGIEGLVHISELAERHVEIPEQVVNVGDDLLVKVIDIDLERRRISLSLKQANEGALTDDSFDPSQYGMEAQYDDKGNYIYPEGFDPETQEWLPGFDKQREEWERRYAAARERFEAHKKQLEDAQKADADAAAEAGEATSYSSTRRRRQRHAGVRRGAGCTARQAGRPLSRLSCTSTEARRRSPPGFVVVLRRRPAVRLGSAGVRVGLTGGVGSGKSTVSALLAEHGAVVIDADAIAREVVQPGTPGFEAVVARFGAGGRGCWTAGSTGQRLAAIVFADPSARADLNAIVHPLVGARSVELMAAAAPDAIVVYDVPLLVESGMAGRVRRRRGRRGRRRDPAARGWRRGGWPSRATPGPGWPRRRAMSSAARSPTSWCATTARRVSLPRQVDALWRSG